MNRFTPQPQAVDVHQHLWPAELLGALRRRTRPPRLRGWTLELAGQGPFELAAGSHDRELRTRSLRRDGFDRAIVSLSSALGIETLPGSQARELIDAYHEGALRLGDPFGAWAAACLSEIDPDALGDALALGLVGLQLPATALGDGGGYARAEPLLAVLEAAGRPLFIHPGPAVAPVGAPGWWSPIVSYPEQMHAAWYAFAAHGRPRHPHLRVCFALLGGLAPLHGERAVSRAGLRCPVDELAFLDTASYGARAIDATVRAVGVDVLVAGTDRPYAEPVAADLGPALEHAVKRRNPHRLLDLQEVPDELALASQP